MKECAHSEIFDNTPLPSYVKNVHKTPTPRANGKVDGTDSGINADVLLNSRLLKVSPSRYVKPNTSPNSIFGSSSFSSKKNAPLSY